MTTCMYILGWTAPLKRLIWLWNICRDSHSRFKQSIMENIKTRWHRLYLICELYLSQRWTQLLIEFMFIKQLSSKSFLFFVTISTVLCFFHLTVHSVTFFAAELGWLTFYFFLTLHSNFGYSLIDSVVSLQLITASCTNLGVVDSQCVSVISSYSLTLDRGSSLKTLAKVWIIKDTHLRSYSFCREWAVCCNTIYSCWLRRIFTWPLSTPWVTLLRCLVLWTCKYCVQIQRFEPLTHIMFI